MHQPLVLTIFSDFGFDRDEVADYIGVGEHHSLGLGRSAGREDDFEWIGRLNLNWTKTLGWALCDCGRQISGIDRDDARDLFEERGPFARTQRQLRSHLRADPERKIRASGIVDGYGNYPAKRASEERRHPLG